MRTAKFLSFLPGIRKLVAETERLRAEEGRRRQELRQLREERRTLKADLSRLRKENAGTRLALQTEPSFAKRALKEVFDAAGDGQSFLNADVSIDLDVRDDMLWNTTTRHYFRAGYDAVRLIHDYFEKNDFDALAIESVLDLPSGFGRVTRFLRAWLPEAKILVSDLQEDGVRSCAGKFGAEIVAAAKSPEDIALENPVDLIWCGSLVTHLDADHYRRFISRFGEFLHPGGWLFFSNHGDRAVERLTSGRTGYGLSESDQRDILTDFRESGFGYRDYPGIENYGVSLASRTWVENLVESLPGLELSGYLPREWAGHHDVAVCRKK